MIRVLLLGAGGAPANSVARCLRLAGGYRIIGANSDPYDLRIADADESHLLPETNHRRFPEAFERLIDAVRPDLVHAQPESQVAYLAGRGLIPANPETVSVCADKLGATRTWEWAGITVPDTYQIDNARDLVNAMSALDGDVWLRANSGAGGSGSLRTHSFTEARAWILRHQGFGNFTAAAVLSSLTVVFQSVWHDGRLIVGQSKRRLRWANARNVPSGIGGSAAISETCSTPIITDVAIAAISAVDPHPCGVFNVDMAYDADGVPNPTEINVGRFNTTVDFFAEAGLNLPHIHMSHVLGEGTPDEPVVNPLRDGLVWIRGMDRPPVLTTREDVEGIAPVAPLQVAA